MFLDPRDVCMYGNKCAAIINFLKELGGSTNISYSEMSKSIPIQLSQKEIYITIKKLIKLGIISIDGDRHLLF